MNKLTSLIIFISLTLTPNLFAKGKSNDWFVGLGATVTGAGSAMVPVTAVNGRYTETEYDSEISDGFDQLSFHIGYTWDMYTGYEVSYSMMNLNNSSGNKEGSLSLIEIDRIIGLMDWNIGFTNQRIDLIVPFLKIGVGMATWSDSISSSSEDISGTIGKVTFGALFLAGPVWIDLSYSVREIGFLSTKTSEQTPLQTSNIAIKYFF